MSERGYFGVAVWHPKNSCNVGTLWRSAHIFGAAFLAVVGGRYHKQPSDTMNSARHVPFYEYDGADSFFANLPLNCELIGVEMVEWARDVTAYTHPERAVYLLGPEDGSLPPQVLERCRSVLRIPGGHCLNLAVAGSVVLYDRVAKRGAKTLGGAA